MWILLTQMNKIYWKTLNSRFKILNDLVQTEWQTLKSENINTYAENITKRITTLTNKHVPNRLINARKTDPAWLTTHVKKLIRKKEKII